MMEATNKDRKQASIYGTVSQGEKVLVVEVTHMVREEALSCSIDVEEEVSVMKVLYKAGGQGLYCAVSRGEKFGVREKMKYRFEDKQTWFQSDRLIIGTELQNGRGNRG